MKFRRSRGLRLDWVPFGLLEAPWVRVRARCQLGDHTYAVLASRGCLVHRKCSAGGREATKRRERSCWGVEGSQTGREAAESLDGVRFELPGLDREHAERVGQ